MSYQLVGVTQTRQIIPADRCAYFPDRYANAPGYVQRHTPVLKLPIPADADLVKVQAQVEVCTKNVTLHPPEFLWDERYPMPPSNKARMGGCFLNCQLRALLPARDPDLVCDAANPPDLLLSTYSGENMIDPITRPYYQPHRFGILEDPRNYSWVVLYVAPNSEAITHPQHVWLGDGAYCLMTLETYKKV